MTCDACDRAAKAPQTVRFNAGCDGCAARALAQSPEFHQAARSGVQTPRYRMALAEFFKGREQDGHAMVKAWADKLRTREPA